MINNVFRKFRLFLFIITFSLLGQQAALGQETQSNVEISVIYPPEFAMFMSEAITKFNDSYKAGLDPLQDPPTTLPSDEVRFHVTGFKRTSGSVLDDITAYVNTGDLITTASYDLIGNKPPTIWIPAVSHWLELANFLTQTNTNTPLYDTTLNDSIGRTAVVIAIWKSRLDLLAPKIKKSPDRVNFSDLIELMNKGWSAYGLGTQTGRDEVFYGRTNPFVSSTGLSMSMLELYTCAKRMRQATGTLKDVLQDEVIQAAVLRGGDLQTCLDSIYQRIVFFDSTTSFVEQITAKGTDFVDFAPISEDDFLRMTVPLREKTEVPLPEPLVAIYPEEGTFWADYPFAVSTAGDGDWMDGDKRRGAAIFKEFLLSTSMQRILLSTGFRPVNESVDLNETGSPFADDTTGTNWNKNGVQRTPIVPFFNDKNNPQILDDTRLNAVQLNWCNVRKRAYIYLLIDSSNSMIAGGKITKALEAAKIFTEVANSDDYIGIVPFSSDGVISELSISIPSEGTVSQTRGEFDRITDVIKGVTEGKPNTYNLFGTTRLYDAINTVIIGSTSKGIEGLKDVTESNVTRAVIVLSDGDSRGDDQKTIDDTEKTLKEYSKGPDPIIVLVVDYSSGANSEEAKEHLQRITNAAKTKALPTDPSKFAEVFDQIGSAFATSPRCPQTK